MICMEENDSTEKISPAGWYPGPDGSQHYWDGSRWLDIEPPPSSEQQAAAPKKGSARKRGVAIGLVIVLLVAGGGGAAYAWKSAQDRQAEEAAALAAEEAASQESEEAAQRTRDRRAAQKAEQDARDEAASRSRRESIVEEIEESVKVQAEEYVSQGYLAGEIQEVICNPTAGGSLSDLDESTTTFECFAVTEYHDDGTGSGHIFEALMNWDSGSYTYGLKE